VATSGQKPWPSAGSFVAAYGQFFMAADTGLGKGVELSDALLFLSQIEPMVTFVASPTQHILDGTLIPNRHLTVTLASRESKGRFVMLFWV